MIAFETKIWNSNIFIIHPESLLEESKENYRKKVYYFIISWLGYQVIKNLSMYHLNIIVQLFSKWVLGTPEGS